MRKPEFEAQQEEETTEPLDIMSDGSPIDRFPLAEAQDDTPEQDGFDIMSGESDDIFSLKQITLPIEAEDTFPKKAHLHIKTSTLIKVLSISFASILLIALIWLEAGLVYTEKLNQRLYQEFLSGENISEVNPNFAFFLTLEGTDITLPVAESEKPYRFTTFDSLFLYPGCATVSFDKKHIKITGSVNTLWDISENDLVEKKIILENKDGKKEYQIINSHKCEKNFGHIDTDKECVTVYIKNNGIFAVHAEKIN